MRMRKGNSLRRLRKRANRRTAAVAFAVIAAGLSKSAPAQMRPTATKKQVNAESMTAPSGGTRIRLRGAKMQTKLEAGKMVLTGFNGGFGGGQVEMSGR